jgi:quercetin dioxygenase-like cupin family protein
MKRLTAFLMTAIAALASAAPLEAFAEPLAIKSLAERTVAGLPGGELYWRIENFSTLPAAQAAAGSHAIAVEAAGRAWLFTLGPAGGASAGGSKVVELGPIPRVAAAKYLLRINEAKGAPGAITSIHTHPGSEAFFVLAGEQSIRSPHGVQRIPAGNAATGHGADVPMQVSSSGQGDLHALVMFVVDATRPFSSPAAMP